MSEPMHTRWTFGDVISVLVFYTVFGAAFVGLMWAGSEVQSWFSVETQSRAAQIVAFLAFLWLWHRVDKLEREVKGLRWRLDREKRNTP